MTVFAVFRHGRGSVTALLALLLTAAMLAVSAAAAVSGLLHPGGADWPQTLVLVALAAARSPVVVAEWRHWRRLNHGEWACIMSERSHRYQIARTCRESVGWHAELASDPRPSAW